MAFEIPRSETQIYPMNRQDAFRRASAKLAGHSAFSSPEHNLCKGDSLELLKMIPSNSIDLVLTDPPYHSTKKANIYGDASFGDDEEYLTWMDQYFAEWHRVLRPNGSIYLFCSSEMMPFLYVQASKTMNMHSTITWTKPNEPGYDGWKQKMKKTALRQWYPHSERIIVCSPAREGNLHKSPFGLFLRDCRKQCELSSNELTEIIGAYGKVNNGGAVSNWETGRNIPSREQYAKMCAAFIGTGKIALMPAYEDVIRAFNVDPSQPFTDVWEHMNVRQYKGKHPAEKPQDLLKLIISTSSYEGDVVLDCFNGSGATMLAAHDLNRRSIGIEIEDKWVEYAAASLSARIKEGRTQSAAPRAQIAPNGKAPAELPLFSV
ncbi:DNA-methyltransferase [Futiania mangrovi]|uniref:Methyltransferase n=1 Tax=Futiania mangrovi TaxID=2959716 RepID=A0A9J6PAP6_9PROT|nr:DNA methyltransferase [Futiania mangrovii]MCP1335142.1 DNA methyltransferase [Futiania mangrovii]